MTDDQTQEGASYVFWMPEYSVGVKLIDDQHKRIFALINKLYTAVCSDDPLIDIGTILEELADYIASHFSTEKSFLRDMPEFVPHEQEHVKFINKTAQFAKDYFRKPQADLMHDILLFLAQWMKDHIKGTDQRQFALYLERQHKANPNPN